MELALLSNYPLLTMSMNTIGALMALIFFFNRLSNPIPFTPRTEADILELICRLIVEAVIGGLFGYFYLITAPTWLLYRYIVNSLSTNE
jgi:hypothetical protein